MGRLIRIMLVTLAVISLAAPAVPAGAASWNSFAYATLSGVWVSPGIATNVLKYDIGLDHGATMNFGGQAYEINWISAFFIRSAAIDTYFTAEDSGLVSEWTWTAKPKGERQDLAGWTSQGNSERLFAGDSKTFQYGNLDITDCDIDTGFHFGYLDGNEIKTGFFYGDIPTITQSAPEPSALQAAGLLTACAGGLAFRGRRQKRE